MIFIASILFRTPPENIVNSLLKQEHLEIEVDESYFGSRRKGKRSCSASNKVTLFGLFKRNSSIYTCVIPNAKADNLMPIIREKVKPVNVIYMDFFTGYDAFDIRNFTH